jgi:glycosyltransferase involved in cell wall biosynthesis
MNVQVVSSVFPISEDEFASSFILREVIALEKAGVQSYITTSRYGEDVNLNGIYVHRIQRGKFDVVSYISRLLGMSERLIFPKPILLWPLCSYCIAKYRDKIIKEARMHNVDLIHAHFAYPDGYAAVLAKNALKKPLVISLRGNDILTEPSIKYGVRLKRHLENRVREAVVFADRIMVASRAEYFEAIGLGVDPKKLVLVPNGVDVNMFNPNIDGEIVRKKFGIEDNLVVLFVGSFLPVKGVRYLLESVPLVQSTIPNATFLLVGEGYQRQFLENLCKSLGISKNVIFVGRVRHSETPLFYAACDVLVSPSLSEGFSNVVIEAMACGKPVIGTSVGGTLDQIKDGVNGYLVQPKNPRELAEKVIQLLSSPKKRKIMGQEGRKLTENEFNMDLRVKRTVDVYKSVL